MKMQAMLPTMFPSFDDRIQEIREVKETIFPIWETLDAGEEFPLQEILDVAIPNLYSPQPKSLYSPQQLRFQKWFESDKGQQTREQLVGTPPVVKLALVAIAAIAYSTGSMGIGATSPEIQRYDESAFAPGVGGFSII